MRILHVITSLRTGGAEKLIADTVPLYISRGIETEVLVFDGVETQLKCQLREKGIKIHELGVGGSVYSPLKIFRLIPFLRKYDIVHTHNTAPQLFAAIAKAFSSANLVTTEHNTYNRRRGWKWYKPIDSWMYSQYKSIICISLGTAENLKSHVQIKCPVVTINNGIKTKDYVQGCALSHEQLGMRKKSVVITMVAGFRGQKDHQTVIRAMSLLSDEYELLLVGDGEEKLNCEEMAKELDVESRVHFLGVRSDVAAILKTSDIVVVSSHWEGFGLVAVEGMAAGKPVIASDVEGLSEVVSGAGVLFPHGDYNSLAKEIKKLANDKDYYSTIANRCSQRAQQYDISKMVDGYIKVYNDVLAK